MNGDQIDGIVLAGNEVETNADGDCNGIRGYEGNPSENEQERITLIEEGSERHHFANSIEELRGQSGELSEEACNHINDSGSTDKTSGENVGTNPRQDQAGTASDFHMDVSEIDENILSANSNMRHLPSSTENQYHNRSDEISREIDESFYDEGTALATLDSQDKFDQENVSSLLSAPGGTSSGISTLYTVQFHWTHGGELVWVIGSWDNWTTWAALSKISTTDFAGTIELKEGRYEYLFGVDGWLRYVPQHNSETSRICIHLLVF